MQRAADAPVTSDGNRKTNAAGYTAMRGMNRDAAAATAAAAAAHPARPVQLPQLRQLAVPGQSQPWVQHHPAGLEPAALGLRGGEHRAAPRRHDRVHGLRLDRVAESDAIGVAAEAMRQKRQKTKEDHEDQDDQEHERYHLHGH